MERLDERETGVCVSYGAHMPKTNKTVSAFWNVSQQAFVLKV